MKAFVQDLVFLLGLALIGLGIGMIYLPAAIVYSGLVLAVIAALMERNRTSN